ncbi:MAG: CocE/NonD family hydrolase [Myxococcota bacterium]
MRETLEVWGQTVRSLAPILGRAVASGQLWRPRCELVEPDPDVSSEYGVEIPARDGYVMTANIFRSRSATERGEPVPVIMCAHPYDNRLTPDQGRTPLGGPPQQYRLISQAGRPRFSTLTSWESPDPDFWVRAGYAVVNLNLPGYGGSDGPPSVFQRSQLRGYHDAIEWVAQQPWCTGRVGLNGVSFLAISQYGVAAGHGSGGEAPAGLAAISPWEGLTDPYRDIFCPGGLPESGFPSFWWSTEVKLALTGEESDFLDQEGCRPPAYATEHPLVDAWWLEKTQDLSQIKVPMLVCASFSDHNLHTVGSFRAFREVGSEHKWLYTHRGGKWDVYYDREVQEFTRCFMDQFVKEDPQANFLEEPTVRLEVRASRDAVYEVRGETHWPPPGTEPEVWSLGPDGQLSDPSPASESELRMDARKGELRFTRTFSAAREITGPMALELSLSLEDGASPPPDVGIFVYVFKRDASGEIVYFRGSVGSTRDPVARGYARAALRKLDEERSSALSPVLVAEEFEPVSPGERVYLPVTIWESSTFFEAGSSLEMQVATYESVASPPYRKDASFNRGQVVLHLGGTRGSTLRVPSRGGVRA